MSGRGCLSFAVLMMGMSASLAWGQTDSERIAELERRVDLLGGELEKAQTGSMVDPLTGETRFGLGAGASKVYMVPEGLSIGGYGEAIYSNYEGDKASRSDFLRAILYAGFKYDDHWVLNTEIEFEHASTDKEGSASVEFAYLEYLHSDAFNLRAGLLLVPMGLVNELHEPNTFLSARRPDIESVILPSTWRENGIGAHGQLGDFSYKAYVITALKGEDFSAAGLRGGRQKGSKSVAEDFAGVLRVDYAAQPGLLIGGSLYRGDSGQDSGVSVDTEIYEGHVDFHYRGLSLRGLTTVARLDGVAALNRVMAANAAAEEGLPTPADSAISSVGEELVGWYVEAGFDLLSLTDEAHVSVTPFVRYETYDTQSKTPAGFKTSASTDVEVITAGLNIKPREEIVFKVDFQSYDTAAGSGTDQLNLSMGYVF